MKSLVKKIFLLVLVSSFTLGLLVLSASAQEISSAPRKIVVFQGPFVNEAEQSALLENFGAVLIKPLPLINGAAVYLPPQAQKGLLRRAEVLRIDDDLVINAIDKPTAGPSGRPKPSQPPQETPWGIDRIEADLAWATSLGSTVKVAILDTGIDLDHLDLKDNIKGNVNTINPRKSGDDDNGHGTHVAGIIAAANNSIGVVGVGPKVSLYAVKVLSSSGSGWLSDLIEGLDWCIKMNMQVINMSLGASSDNVSFHTAISKAYQAGIIEVAAAGNNGATTGAVDYPAKYSETIAVSAVGNNNGSLYFASFSSYGPEVDLTAPGVDIKSTYSNGYYANMSGTSMAAPHVTGVAALVLYLKPTMIPDDMKNYLKGKAESLGLPIDQQGAGLIRADYAVQ